MKDRLVAGGLVGIIAGLIQYAYGLIVLSLGLTDRIFGQFSDIVFGGRVYSGILGFILGILTHSAVTISKVLPDIKIYLYISFWAYSTKLRGFSADLCTLAFL